MRGTSTASTISEVATTIPSASTTTTLHWMKTTVAVVTIVRIAENRPTSDYRVQWVVTAISPDTNLRQEKPGPKRKPRKTKIFHVSCKLWRITQPPLATRKKTRYSAIIRGQIIGQIRDNKSTRVIFNSLWQKLAFTIRASYLDKKRYLHGSVFV